MENSWFPCQTGEIAIRTEGPTADITIAKVIARGCVGAAFTSAMGGLHVGLPHHCRQKTILEHLTSVGPTMQELLTIADLTRVEVS
jgi:hypothetical protein